MRQATLRMSLLIVAVALSMVLVGAPASAQFYAGGKGSVFMPNSSEDGLEDFDTGSGGEIFAGYRFIPYFGLELGAGYYQTNWSDSFFDSGREIDADATVSVVPLVFTAKGFVPLGTRARLYAGAGLGWYFAKAEIEESWSDPDFADWAFTSSRSQDDDDSVFGYHAVLGGEYMVAPRFGLQAEAKWFAAEPEFDFDGDAVGGTDVKVGGVMFSFGALFQL